MAKLSILAGATSQSVNLWIQDSSSTVGAGLSGLVFNSGSLIAYYTFTGANATATAISLVTLAAVNSAYSSGGFKEIDATHMKGLYRLDIPNAALAASSGQSVTLMLSGATNMAPCVLEIELTAWNNQDGVHGGLSALPNTAVTTNASLLTSGTGTDQLSVTSGRIDVGKALGTAVTLDANNVLNVSTKYLGGTLQTARDIGASVLLSAGTGTGQLDFTSGVVKANLAQILGTALTETAGQIAAAFKQFFNIATPAATMDHLKLIDTATAVTNGVTVTTNNDKTGYSLSQAFPTNFSALGITVGGKISGVVLADTVTTYTGNTVQTGDAYARLGAPAGASTSADIAAVKVDTAAVKVQTDKLTFTVANQIDANVLDWKSATAPAMTGDAFARLGAPAGVSVSADIAGVQTDTTNLKTRVPAALSGGLMKSDVLAVNTNATSAANLAIGTQAVVTGTVGSASSTTSVVTSSMTPAAAVTGQFIGRTIIFDANTTTTNLQGQAASISASTAGGVLTVSTLTTAPVSGDVFAIY